MKNRRDSKQDLSEKPRDRATMSSVISKQTQLLLRKDPSHINKILAKAVACYQAGELAEAEACYRQILAENPQHSDSLHLLGLIFANREQDEEAISLMSQAIFYHPDIAIYYSNRAALYQRLGRHKEAVNDFYDSLQIDPKQVGVWVNFGNSLVELKKISGALDAYQKALELEPDYYYTHQMMGHAYRAQESYEEALTSFQKALSLKPDSIDALVNVGVALAGLKRFDESLNTYKQALMLQPENPNIYCNLGLVLTDLEQYEAAEKHYHQAIAIDPALMSAYVNLWLLYYDQGKYQEASEYLQKAQAINPQHSELLWNEALILLQQGNFKEGWEKYEIRQVTLKEYQKRPKLWQPRWKGESFSGKTLLVRVEQGLGDTLQFIRYLPLVKERGGRVIVECQRELLTLLKASYSTLVNNWIPVGGTPPIFDYYIDLMSLPLIFQTTVDTIPFSEGYLQPSVNSVLTEKIKGLSSYKKIGFVWAGNPQYKKDVDRSMSLSRYKPVLDLEGFTFCSLQWGKKGTDDIAREKLDSRLINLTAELNDFLDTATVVNELDLIITTDTSMAHLVGGLGKKAWLLLSASPDFRWLLEGESTPWYRSLKLFRQPKPRDWDSVIQRVIDELKVLN